MRICFLYGSWALGSRKLDFENLETSKRGLTGSELSCIMFCRAMAARGHETTFALDKPPDGKTFDVVYAWIQPDLLRGVSARLRICCQQCNDFEYAAPGYADVVDVFTSPSEPHRDYLESKYPETAGKWEIVPNGCDSSQYTAAKVPGRVLYASSPDRGLHLLLQAWPEIKRRVPHAHLRVLYELEGWAKNLRDNTWPDPGIQECGQRARYIELALARMQHLDVTAVGSVSRQDMAREMGEAEVLAYPCDTIRWTEGFSVTTLEACAAGAVPVISDVDSLGHIYRGLLMVPAPARNHMSEFTEYVVQSLLAQKQGIQSFSGAMQRIAAEHEWPVLAERLERIMLRHLNPLSNQEKHGEAARPNGDSPVALPVG